ncbi:hypothetical protein I5M32_11145 [Pedobacter sp. SD-b]|uniref:Glycerophosphoryl diester phosphodiesterase membrane domain-containing protein n=1 Tax=Pedobacter segetis TaxID=2793069 RepID=A0ABS1BL34_9SPHI|nr:hypothetical protein [Pedobacter segetis]MBK0383513.1 hypothetical protein [Pedobacter segetis]
MEQSFSVLDILETSWDLTKKNFLIIIGYSLVAFITIALVQLIYMGMVASENVILSTIGFFSFLIVNSMANLGFYKLIFRLIDEEEEDFSVKAVIPSWKNIFSFVSITLLIGVIVATFTLVYTQLLKVGSFADFVETLKGKPIYLESLAVFAFILLLLAAMRFMFFPCFIVDDDSTGFESLRQSRALSQDNLIKIMVVLALVVAFIALGFLALGIGIIVTYPFTNVILVVTYRRLVNDYINEHPEEQKVG